MYRKKTLPSTRKGREEFLAANRKEKAARDAEIIRLLNEGLKTNEIAARTGVSVTTVQRRRLALKRA